MKEKSAVHHFLQNVVFIRYVIMSSMYVHV